MTKTYIEYEDIALMADMATNLRDRLLIWLLFKLGCRISEALGITVDDIDFTHYTVTIKHLKSRSRFFCLSCAARVGFAYAFCPKCGSEIDKAQIQQQEHRRMRVLPVDEETVILISDYIKRGGPLSREGKKYLFGINRHRAWQIVRDCAEKAGLEKLVNPDTGRTRGISPHRLHDSFAVHAMKLDDSGDGLRLLQKHFP